MIQERDVKNLLMQENHTDHTKLQCQSPESESNLQEQQRTRQMLAERKKTSSMFENSLEMQLGWLYVHGCVVSEESYQNTLRSIVEETTDVQVLPIKEYDDAGEVFEIPLHIELDIIIQNELLIACEMRSSISRGDVFVFERKVKFYEKRHQCTISQKVIISPMVSLRAMNMALSRGMHVYRTVEDVTFNPEE